MTPEEIEAEENALRVHLISPENVLPAGWVSLQEPGVFTVDWDTTIRDNVCLSYVSSSIPTEVRVGGSEAIILHEDHAVVYGVEVRPRNEEEARGLLIQVRDLLLENRDT